MLSQISLKNFFSIRDNAILDMRASNSRAFKNAETHNNLFNEDGVKMLKSIAIFGANASGKSNFLSAIDVCLRYIRDSHSFTELTSSKYETFKFDDEVTPSTFEIELIIEGEKYEYGFSVLAKKIIEEHLYAYPKKYKSLVFKRESSGSNESAYTFSKKFARPKEVVASTSSYTLFLTRAALMNRPEPLKILNFVTDNIAFDIPSFESNKLENLLKNHKPTIINALRYADSDIVDYDFRSVSDNEAAKRLVTFHKNNPAKPFNFDSEESAGTRRLLRLLATFIDAAENGKVLILDELEKSLHPQLVKYAVKLFNKSDKAQMIFSTHDLNLLDIDILRPDQIYFASKDYSTGASEIYSLADFVDYKNFKNIRRDYEQGRFDAIPILPNI